MADDPAFIYVRERRLPYETFDADNHMYETRDALTKFIPREFEGVIKYVDINGRTKVAVKDRISDYIPNPTFQRVAVPGGYGQDVTHRRTYRRARLGLARTFQRLELFSSLSATDNVRVGLESTGAGSASTAVGLLERVGLRAEASSPVSSLPTGSARLVELARALSTDPKVLLLDEPCSGLDERETETLGHLLTSLAAEGRAVVLVEHDTELVLRVCNTVHVLDFGQVIACGPPEQVRGDPTVQEAYLGHAEEIESDMEQLEAGQAAPAAPAQTPTAQQAHPAEPE